MSTAEQTLEADAWSMPILGGALFGWRWCPGSGGKVLRLLLGTYEREQTRLFLERIRPGDVVFDIGASVGYYTLLSAKIVGPAGKVIAFEPDPRNASYLRRHIAGNRAASGPLPVEVLQTALGAENGSVGFGAGTGTGTSRVTDMASTRVEIRRLDDLIEEHRWRPDHVKIDVEGHELAVLNGGARTLRDSMPTIYLSTHDEIRPGVHAECLHWLRDAGYEVAAIGHDDLATATEVLATPRRS